MFQIKLNRETPLTPEAIKKIINKHQEQQQARLNKLDKYYHTKNEILLKTREDESLPNNKIAHPYASYITDTLTGYFMGEGVSYSSLDTAAVDELKMVLEYNDEQDENTELAKDMSIFGSSVELLYIDEDGMIRLKRIDPREIIVVYDDTLNEDILYGIRYYPCEDIVTDEKYYMIEVYTDSEIIVYKSNELISNLVEQYRMPHYFSMCPVVVYNNNEEHIGDFEPVISLIDAYDKMESDSLDDFDYFVDAYLVLTGLNADSDDIKAMKENRVILLDADSDAKWLTKDAADSAIENAKNRLDKDIHKFSKTPDMSDEAFSGNSSGVAIKYKTMPMENIVSIKERKFKKGLQRRIELICVILALKGSGFDWRSIDITFTRNLPTNDTEIANVVNTLSNVVSTRTLLSQIPFVEDVDEEMKRIEQEKENNPFYDIRLGLNGEDEDGDEDRTETQGQEKN